MRALILGTSNGFFSLGYVQAIKDRFSEVVNLSLGASPSTLIPYRLRDTELSAFDFVFVETAINDGVMMHQGAICLDHVRALLLWTAQQATAAGCVPVGLICPDLRHSPRLEDARLANAEAFGPLVVDFRAAADRLAADLGRPVSDLYHDTAHLRPELMRSVMEDALGGILASAAIPPRPAPMNFVCAPLAEMLASGSASGIPATAIPAKTSVVDDNLFAIIEDQSLTINTGGRMLAGVILNQSNSRAFVRIAGARTVCADWRMDYGKTDFKVIAASIPVPIEPDRNGSVTLTVMSDAPVDMEAFSAYYRKPNRIEVAGLILADGGLPAHHAPDPAAPCYAPRFADIRRSYLARHPASSPERALQTAP